jgi:hypothetical protein
MTDPTGPPPRDNGHGANGRRIADAVDNTLSKAIARWVVPSLLAALVGTTVWLGRTALGDIDDIKKIMGAEAAKTATFRERIDNMIRTMDERDRRHDEGLSDHERRLREAERKLR